MSNQPPWPFPRGPGGPPKYDAKAAHNELQAELPVNPPRCLRTSKEEPCGEPPLNQSYCYVCHQGGKPDD
jgi:hypothetical protein